ncbi:DUF2384 domain-containing protein [Variovorax sp. dw_954]|uniref:DUF2384 domain-containing protein n=1 Tax=Variovorax sp. dw_954 TaxID=2720078 RepID=UPI001BD3A02F|nr:DUF2384 domain-containing protein [Variovorax sp. dw_954]
MLQESAIANPRELHAYADFSAYLHDPTQPAHVLSPTRWADAMGVPVNQLAAQAGVHRNTLRLSPTSPLIQTFLLDSLRVLKAAFDVSGDMQVSIRWYRTEPLSVFRYATAEMLVSQGRATDVLNYIESLSAGALG